ncbi:S-layer homology domain-containing protein [Chakrabartyella piscis]|uniref:S-layer homology domain-containing protein n=1 Tax=Chakrabartyella piscis TaxID=2918914 RepID=UPI00295872D7|nr:S-layer homology domain-containing protein [Chakrabartyella piscis]
MKLNLKKKFTLVLATIMASSCISVTSFGATYADIDDVPWEGAKDIIQSVSDLGLISGYEDNTFRANNNVTYLEVMQMFYNTLIKSGADQYMDIVDQASYTYIMEHYGVPTWAQKATAYFLYTGAIASSDLSIFMTNGVSNAAPRSDVAEILGNALSNQYSYDRTYPSAYAYADSWRFSSDQIAQIDLVSRLGIFSGNTNNNFLPDDNINRAEMAVVLNKTYPILAESAANIGEITNIVVDGTWYDLTIDFDYGDTYVISAQSGLTDVYADTSGTQVVSVARLSVGDRISVVYENNIASEIRLQVEATESTTTSTSDASFTYYDILGNITEIDDYVITFDDSTTWNEEEVDLRSTCIYYLDGEKVNYSEMVEAIEDNDYEYAVAGMNLYYDWDIDDEVAVEVYVNELYVELTDVLQRSGKVEKMESTYITVATFDGLDSNSIYYASDCEFYLFGDEIDDDDAEELVDNGNFYIMAYCDTSGKATEIHFLEEPTAGHDDDMETWKVSSYAYNKDRDDKLIIYNGTEKITMDIDTDDIDLYILDFELKDWESVSGSTMSYYQEDECNDNGYVKLYFDYDGNLTHVYMAPTIAAFDTNLTSMILRKGVVTSYDSEDGFTLDTSEYIYTMLTQYNVSIDDKEDTYIYATADPNDSGKDVKYPLSIPGMNTSSKTVFEKVMANFDDITLSIDVVATRSGEVQGLTVYLEEVNGTFVSYDDGDDEFIIALSDGYEMKLNAKSKPDVEADDDDDFDLEELEAYKYKGTEMTLYFNSKGMLDEVYMPSSSTASTIKGVAVGSDDGLEIEGKSTVYKWLSSSKTTVTNKSMTSTALKTIQAAIEDPDVEVYVEFTVELGTTNVSMITAYVLEAEGELDEFDADDKIARITTDAGNTFSIEFNAGYTVYIDDEEEETERTIQNTLEGTTVTFDFGDNGKADAMYGES